MPYIPYRFVNILITSREALFPTTGGHREYLFESVKGLADYGNHVDILSWGKEENYVYNNSNITEYHYKSDNDKLTNNLNLKLVKKFASSLGIGQMHTIRHKGLGMEYSSNFLKNKYDIVMQNGPDSNSIAQNIGDKLQIPKIERLDWVGLPYRTKYYKMWLNYVGEPYYPYMYFYKFVDKYITKLEAASTAKMDFVYTPTRADMLKLSQFSTKSKLNYVMPFLNKKKEDIANNNKKLNYRDKYILFYSTPSFNSFEAIKYLYKIAKKNENLKFKITGNFEVMRKTFSRENLIFLGELPIDEFYNILRNAHIVVFPLTAGHGIQMKLIRAFSYSKAVIANDGVLKPIENIMKDYEDIIIGETPMDFYTKMLDLYQDETLIEKIGRNSYKVYEKYFSPDVSIQGLNTYLNNCKNQYSNNL